MRALRIGLRAGNIPGQSGVIRRPGFVDPLVHGGNGVLRRQHLRMILQRQRFGIAQIQLDRRARLRQNAPAVLNSSKSVTEESRIIALQKSS